MQRSQSLGNLRDYTAINMPKIKVKKTGLTKTQKCLTCLAFTTLAINAVALTFNGYAFYEAYTVITSLLRNSANASLGLPYP